MAHLKTKATIGNLTEREAWKWQIIRSLYERGLNKVQINKLYGIIDRMMTLSKELQIALVRKIKVFEEERKMPLISPTIELAREEGEQNMIIQLLNYRFGEIDSSIIEQIKALTREQLAELGKAIFNFSFVTDLHQWLQSRLKLAEQEVDF